MTTALIVCGALLVLPILGFVLNWVIDQIPPK